MGIKFEVYDRVRTGKMGKEEGYMGTFNTETEAIEYCIQFKHLFEFRHIDFIHYPNYTLEIIDVES